MSLIGATAVAIRRRRRGVTVRGGRAAVVRVLGNIAAVRRTVPHRGVGLGIARGVLWCVLRGTVGIRVVHRRATVARLLMVLRPVTMLRVALLLLRRRRLGERRHLVAIGVGLLVLRVIRGVSPLRDAARILLVLVLLLVWILVVRWRRWRIPLGRHRLLLMMLLLRRRLWAYRVLLCLLLLSSVVGRGGKSCNWSESWGGLIL